MKTKIFLALVISALVLGACAPAAVEEAPAPEVMEESPAQEAPAAEAPAPAEAAPAEGAVMADEVSFSQDLVPVLDQFANPAHTSSGRGGVFLSTYEDVLKYVVPGNPEESELYRRLMGDGVPVMPPSGKLPDETIQLFYDWILQGAKDN